MNTSSLLSQYPLSPKKLWKKVIEKTILFGILALGIGGAYTAFSLISDNPPVSSIVISAIGSTVIAFALIMGLYVMYIKHYIRTYFYENEGDFLTIRKGVFMPVEIHVQYLKMQDVYVDQDILDRILGIYDVHISSATATSGIAAHIDGVSKESADGLKKLFLQTIKDKTYGYNAHMSGNQPASVAAQGEPIQQNAHVQLPETISSDQPQYKLSSEWWIGEWVKIAGGALLTPAIIALWISGRFLDRDSVGGMQMSTVFWIWLALVAIYIVGSVVKLLLWKNNYHYSFTEQYVYMKEGIISISEKNLPYNSIQDVRVSQGFIDRIFGVADVHIENASGGINLGGRNGANSASAGIVIEGLDVAQARHLTDILKNIIIKRPGMRGL